MATTSNKVTKEDFRRSDTAELLRAFNGFPMMQRLIAYKDRCDSTIDEDKLFNEWRLIARIILYYTQRSK